jgi:hypothetical protein
MKLGKRLEMMQELKSIKENKQETETCNCGCENCQCNVKEEEKTEENETVLSDKEIEEIIKTEYGDKNDKTKAFIRKGLKKFGKDKFTYYKTNIPNESLFKEWSKIKIIITCPFHGDTEILAYHFLRFYKGCHECIHGRPFIKNIGLDEFERRLKITHPHYSIIPGVSVYKNDKTRIKLHCDIHDVTFSIRPEDIFRSHGGCNKCKEDRIKEISNERHKKAGESLIKKIEEKFPGQYDFSEFEFKGSKNQWIKIKCNQCGEIINLSVTNWWKRVREQKCLCPKCSEELYRQKRADLFKEKVEEAFPGHFDLTNVNFKTYHVPATGFKCLKCGAEFDVAYPDNFLVGAGCPHCDSSIGEAFVRNWLNNNKNIINSYVEQLPIDNSIIVGKYDNWGVVIDFSLNYNGITFWIECNGEQHYVKNSFFHKSTEDFDAQLRRDANIKKYCELNNIVLIEIPYTYYKQKQIDIILNKIILENISSTELIKIPSISYYRTKKEKEEAEKDGKF